MTSRPLRPFTVTVVRTERTSYEVWATDAEHAKTIYGTGEETISDLSSAVVEDVEEGTTAEVFG